MNDQTPSETLRDAALRYHEFPKPGKLATRVTKPMATQRDLSLAYSPGVAEACTRIAEDEADSYRYTSRGNQVAVISNGTAVLGLGNIGAAASKPVMEGKVALFKKFANIDGVDIEVNETDPERLAEIVIALEPSFGAVNLEDIGAPACFEVERICKERMNIPVFHDDQHGTAIVVAAAALNAMRLAGKSLSDIKMVAIGAGAAGIACLNLLCDMGLKRRNVWLFDRRGVIYKGRENVDATKALYARDADDGPMEQVIEGADMFLGLSGPGNLTGEMVAKMAKDPVIFALSNPTPEILPEEAKAAREDVIIATGRSDYPNQVNNVLCFPFIFRGAMDVGATQINEAMKVACAKALADLARKTTAAETAAAYRGERMVFGREYLIPKPFDPRLLGEVASAVARAAIGSGVAKRPIADIAAYKAELDRSVFRTGMIMRPVFELARRSERRIVFAEGEDERVLHCTQSMLLDGMGPPILIGRPDVIRQRIDRAGISLKPDTDFEVCNPEDDPRYRDYWQSYHAILERRGVTPDLARTRLRTSNTAIAAIMVHRGEADSLICGSYGLYLDHLRHVEQVLGGLPDGDGQTLHPTGALSTIILDDGAIFIADTQVRPDPSPEEVAETAISAARHIRRFGIEPKIALVSHSVFGNLDIASGRKMRRAVEILDAAGVDFAFEGEMQADHALNPDLRARVFPNSRLHGAANCLVFANVDAASGAANVLRQLAGGLEIGPILMGMGNKAHVVNSSVSARGLFNIAALARAPVQSYA
ncbi:NADP-dependent malic enzyme [Defluviimonas sp. WL0024]|uniref:NADP-dependent malic enzyme n=2 Tax=Albidovulum TaxID=205889 RepID=A0ABT3J8W3_9RHOB|nr:MULTISPECIES: NADP-dependent malic enzyme [Defluviimonas]MCU9850483.1 NADP-dependent malic enzyme [Defluviimonas sp. WL0024]MCW3784129.1 NADP-dependent malic enzyme [Defluviimonas salinarum]